MIGVSATGKNKSIHLYYRCSKCKRIYDINEKKIEKEIMTRLDDIFDFYSLLDNTFITTTTTNYRQEIKNISDKIIFIIAKEENAKNVLLEGLITSDELRATLDSLSKEKMQYSTRLKELEYQSTNLLTFDNACNRFNFDNYKYNKISHYVRYNHLWNNLSNVQKQTIISKYVNKIIVGSNNKKDFFIKNIQIKENELADFSYKFRYDIFASCLSIEEQTDILNTYTFEVNSLHEYYEIGINQFEGVKVNINDTLETILFTSDESSHILITI